MTFKVNIEHGASGAGSTSLYTTDEIISYGLSGCLYAGEVCLQELIEKIVDDPMTKEEAYTEDDIDIARREGYEEACEEIIGFVRNL
jgi:hypothetical protein